MKPKQLKPCDVTFLVDTREQTPFCFAGGFQTQRATLKTGDYTVLGLQDEICIERKSLSDLLGCIGNSRERFEAELKRMLDFKARAVVVSASEAEIAAGNWHYSKLKPNHVIGSCTGWMTWGIPFIFADGHEKAAHRAAHFMWLYARRHLKNETTYDSSQGF